MTDAVTITLPQAAIASIEIVDGLPVTLTPVEDDPVTVEGIASAAGPGGLSETQTRELINEELTTHRLTGHQGLLATYRSAKS